MKTVDNFRDYLKKYLFENGIKQNYLAKKMKIEPSEVNDFLAGRRNFREPRMLKICKILKIDYFEAIKPNQLESIARESPPPTKARLYSDRMENLVGQLIIITNDIRREIRLLNKRMDPMSEGIEELKDRHQRLFTLVGGKRSGK